MIGLDILDRNIRELPYFRGILRAIEGRFYQNINLPHPILDVGCGDGHFTSVTFTDQIDIGIDPWARPLKEAYQRQVYSLVMQADGSHIPFPTNYFSSAMSNSVLEHIPNLMDVLFETARVLKPGAPFVFCVPNQHYLDFLSIAAAFDRMGLKGIGSAYRSWFKSFTRVSHADDPQVWEKRLVMAGFVLEKYWDYFSSGAMHTLEWGHLWGIPSLVARWLTGKWILWPSRFNLSITKRIVEPYFLEALPEKGSFTFYLARRI